MSIINEMMARFPGMEVGFRTIYQNYLLKNKAFKKIKKKYLKPSDNRKEQGITWDEYRKHLDALGIAKGDILIVHSSMDPFHAMGIKEEFLLDYLKEMVGESGTLVLPAFPLYPQKQEVKAGWDEVEESVKIYEPDYTVAWTGLLPNLFCGMEGTLRSSYPNNSLAASGLYADELIRDNLKADLSHGEHSGFLFCSEHEAKVLFLGIAPYHCVSEIHICEDTYWKEWPIDGWYKNQKYIIKTSGGELEKVCRIRKKFWNRYLTEHYCIRQMALNGVIQVDDVGDVPLAIIPNLKEMTAFVKTKMEEGDLLFYKIPKKYWKEKMSIERTG